MNTIPLNRCHVLDYAFRCQVSIVAHICIGQIWKGVFCGGFDPPLEAAMYCHLFVLGYIRISLTCFAYFCGAAMMKMLFHAPPNSSSSTQQQQHPAATSVPATAIANKTSEKSLTHSNLKGVFNCVNLTPFTAHQPRTNFTPLRNP